MDGGEPLDSRTEKFNRLQDVPREERDRIQRQQLIDRAAAAIAAARALISETRPEQFVRPTESGSPGSDAQQQDKGIFVNFFFLNEYLLCSSD